MTHSVAGARAQIEDPEAELRRAQRWAADREAEVCLADARCVFGRDHLESAALHAERAKGAGTMATRSLSMEALLYIAGERQVADAIRAAGLSAHTEAVAVVLFGSATVDGFLRDMGWSREDAVLAAAGKALDPVRVSKVGRTTITEDRASELALERVALVDLEK